MNGLAEFVDTEILSKIDDWRKWVFGAGVGFYLSQGKEIVEQLKENNLVRKMNLIDKNNKINVDLLYKEMCEYYSLPDNFINWSQQREIFINR